MKIQITKTDLCEKKNQNLNRPITLKTYLRHSHLTLAHKMALVQNIFKSKPLWIKYFLCYYVFIAQKKLKHLLIIFIAEY